MFWNILNNCKAFGIWHNCVYCILNPSLVHYTIQLLRCHTPELIDLLERTGAMSEEELKEVYIAVKVSLQKLFLGKVGNLDQLA